jgi:hypothetical protein
MKTVHVDCTLRLLISGVIEIHKLPLGRRHKGDNLGHIGEEVHI